eukprot:CAMPEP_0184681272 /NCGR_PEP_ID=MMETSP0312-20130426/4219_1 /TAXON_ID=31354 /ORGANISM="Compsopogon coeruleus, Strain SAG 36.94" /LENGTH=782 /DNA_ID=CAMNT_0027131979 /DNA_START=202 /DNA_END=2550 /DNA_ORIENTATION=+
MVRGTAGYVSGYHAVLRKSGSAWLGTSRSVVCGRNSSHGWALSGLKSWEASSSMSGRVPRGNWKMSSVADDGSVGTATVADPEKYEFKAEVSRVMDIIINSLYSNKEIFLRELLSNASDACEKRRFLGLTEGEADDEALKIRVKADKDAGTVVIEDNGVGMTKAEMVQNLGSIATSGTKKFVEALGEGKGDVTQIGQFGVGFYASYLVADRVKVESKSYADKEGKQFAWESDSKSGYSITEQTPDLEGKSGTRITLFIKDGSKEFLENFRLKDLMKRYSEFLSFPIYAWDERTEYEEEPDGDEVDEEGKPKMKKVPKTVEDWAKVNVQKPIWMRRPKEVTDEEYSEFYKTISRDFDGPLARSHFSVEGEVEFRSLIFTPKMLPFELRENMFDERGRSLKLYVKRVFISDKFEGFVPRWLTFMRGVVDSEDLPLNVSREILQQSKVLRVISKRLIRKSLDMFQDIAGRDNKDEYKNFWKQFGRYIKAGIIDDADYKDDLAKLCRFNSSSSPEELISLKDYVDRMQDGQEDIYYISADNKIAAQNSAAIEKLKEKGYDVIFALEPIDEIAVQTLATFKCTKEGSTEEKNYKLVDVSKEDFKLDELSSEDEKQKKVEQEESFKDVISYIEGVLQGKVGKVKVSDRLTESASAIVGSQYGVSATMERYMRMNRGVDGDDGMMNFMGGTRTLEINPNHPIVESLARQVKATATKQSEETATLLFELAMLSGGYPIEDTPGFAKRVSRIVGDAASVSSAPISSDEEAAEAELVDAEVMDEEVNPGRGA